MQTKDRFRQPEQLNLYHPPLRLPRWKALPNDVRQSVIWLIAQMLGEHSVPLNYTARQGETTDE